jgi:hypothetical protein
MVLIEYTLPVSLSTIMYPIKGIESKEVYLFLFQTNNIFVKPKEHETYGWFTFEYANKKLKESLRKALEKANNYILKNLR